MSLYVSITDNPAVYGLINFNKIPSYSLLKAGLPDP